MKIYIRKIQKDKLEIIKNWAEKLKERKDEVMESLDQEGVDEEMLSYFEINGEFFAIFIEHAKGNILPSNKKLKINQEHIEVLKDTLTPPIDIYSLYNFKK